MGLAATYHCVLSPVSGNLDHSPWLLLSHAYTRYSTVVTNRRLPSIPEVLAIHLATAYIAAISLPIRHISDTPILSFLPLDVIEHQPKQQPIFGTKRLRQRRSDIARESLRDNIWFRIWTGRTIATGYPRRSKATIGSCNLDHCVLLVLPLRPRSGDDKTSNIPICTNTANATQQDGGRQDQ